MTIDNKEMPFEVEYEIKAMYDRTFESILRTVEEADKFRKIQAPKVGDCLLKISKYPTTTVVYIAICKNVECIQLPNSLRLMLDKDFDLNRYQFSMLTATPNMMHIDDTSWCPDIGMDLVVSEDVWGKCEKLYLMLKKMFESMMMNYNSKNTNIDN